MPLILGTNSIKDTGYEVANSCRFNDGSSDYLSRTNTSPTSAYKCTFSAWVKRSNIGSRQRLMTVINPSSTGAYYFVEFTSGDNLGVNDYDGVSSGGIGGSTARKFRDTNAWYHIVVAYDTTQATGTNRIKVYVNGVEDTFNFDATGDQNRTLSASVSGKTQLIGYHGTSSMYYDGYMSEVCFIDGQALDPTSFGEFDEDSPTIWKPKDVSGLTFGTNGFYLDFENASSLGADVSGNSNNFTVNNLTSIDQTTDTCTNNFATLNPLRSIGGNVGTYSEGNTIYTAAYADWQGTVGTIGSTAGKWYWEYKLLGGTYHINGIVSDIPSAYVATHDNAAVVGGFGGYIDNGSFHARFDESDISGWDTGSVGVSFTTNDIVNVALDMDNKFLYFGKNGTWMKSGDPTSGATGTGGIDIGTPYDTVGLFAIPAVSIYDSGASGSINFGNPSFTISSGNTDGDGYGNFEYAVPSGYYSLNSKNLSEFG